MCWFLSEIRITMLIQGLYTGNQGVMESAIWDQGKGFGLGIFDIGHIMKDYENVYFFIPDLEYHITEALHWLHCQQTKPLLA